MSARTVYIDRTALPDAPPERPAFTVSACDAAELLAREIPRREVLLTPWLTAQSLSMLWAWRGTGKTWAALWIAYAVATGDTALGWRATQPRRVLYLDGELPAAELQHRVAQIQTAIDPEPAPGFLRFVTPDFQRAGMPNIASAQGQLALAPLAAESDLIIVDSIATLGRAGRENETEGWQPVAQWALEQRASGRAVLFIHHGGKNGQQRGTSSREDILDTVISLRHPKDYSEREGARFLVQFDKCRSLKGAEVDPFEALLDRDQHGRLQWTCKPADIGRNQQIEEMLGLGMSMREIAGELGIGLATVHRTAKAIKEGGDHD